MNNHEPNQTEPLLNQDDFNRLIYSGVWSLLTRQRGLPPDLPSLEKAKGQSLKFLQINELNKFDQLNEKFFGLKNISPAQPSETIASYAERLFDLWRNGQRTITFYTSGSTGEPVPSLHSEEMLRQEIAEAAALLPHPSRVMVTVPLLHSYGFVFGVLFPKILNIRAIDTPPLPTIISGLMEKGDMLVTFPMLLARLQNSPPPNVTTLSATAPCPDELFQELTQKGFASLTEIYGASETGAIAARLGPGWFKLLGYWQKASDNHLQRKLTDGKLMPFPLPDHAKWHDDEHFRPAGRRDKAVQVGGVNVYPAKVAAVILEHKAVKECAVRLMTPQEGERLKAFVVPDPKADEQTVRRELAAWLKAKLSPPERPGSLMFGPRLPISVSGKAADWPIR